MFVSGHIVCPAHLCFPCLLSSNLATLDFLFFCMSSRSFCDPTKGMNFPCALSALSALRKMDWLDSSDCMTEAIDNSTNR